MTDWDDRASALCMIACAVGLVCGAGCGSCGDDQDLAPCAADGGCARACDASPCDGRKASRVDPGSAARGATGEGGTGDAPRPVMDGSTAPELDAATDDGPSTAAPDSGMDAAPADAAIDSGAAPDAAEASTEPLPDPADVDAGSEEVPSSQLEPPSCMGLAATCGRLEQESCCTTRPVRGGSFYRDYDAMNGGPLVYPGRVSDFALDKYEVTVGRFRKFVAAWKAGWRPVAGAGKHTHLNDGLGLTSVRGGYEPGWDTTWSAELATLMEAWNGELVCESQYQTTQHQTWTSTVGSHEGFPINCATWYEQYAFCIWDGGFLPTTTEWNYAAVGGDEHRYLPWSIPPASTITDDSYAVYCGSDCSPRAVGSRAPKGNGRYGHADLGGSLAEATLDIGLRGPECNDCLQLDPTDDAHGASGSSFYVTGGIELLAWQSTDLKPAVRVDFGGMRCARAPSVHDEPEPVPAGTSVTEAFSSCDGLPETCGPQADENCCASSSVAGGSFNRGHDPLYPATLSDFRLDRFEITVGRFRKFVAAWTAGFRPQAGAGKHRHLNGGLGLRSAGGYESGWDSRWTANVATTAHDWNAALTSCGPSYDEWSVLPGANETRPVQCITFYEAYAFCIWDGGFLPSDAEWSFAASGGSAQRLYPWGGAEPDDGYAVFGPNGVTSLPVGSLSPRGDGLFGQADLAGNTNDWVLDFWNVDYETSSCVDCVDATTTPDRVARGGGLGSPPEMLLSATRGAGQQATRGAGGRCARPPQ